jgi:hypothetical protein
MPRRSVAFFGPALLAIAYVAFAFVGCNSLCPGNFDPADNPAGDSCVQDRDCRVECVCENEDGDEIGAFAGACTDKKCDDAAELCPGACGVNSYSGKYCDAK